MDEGTIDKSQFLPLKAVNDRFEFLKQKGLAVFNRGKLLKSKQAKLPLDRLTEDEIAHCDGQPVLTEEQGWSGNEFKTLCDVAAGRTSAIGAKDGTPSQKNAILHKIAIEAQLIPPHKHTIRRIIIYSQTNPLIEEEYKAIRERLTHYIRDAFDCLMEAMKPENIERMMDSQKQPIPPELQKRLDASGGNK